MNDRLSYIYLSFWVFCLVLTTFSSEAQQLKLGSDPTQIEKSVVLQLDSKNQGLLLTRVPDTNAINSLMPPDGMIIYFTDGPSVAPYGVNAGVYQRKDGAWQRLAQFFEVSTDPVPPDGIAFTQSYDTITLHLPEASKTTRGVVTARQQEFAGDKYFVDSLIASGGFRSNTAQINGNLKLLLSVNNHPAIPKWFLTTDKEGSVSLQSIDDVFWKLSGNSVSETKRLGTITSYDLPIITNNQERMRITKEGKVGINTTSPSDDLTVNGSFKLGNGGSSFSSMAYTHFDYQITVDNNYDTHRFSVPGVKKNAHIMINPQSSLRNGSTYASIVWVYADTDNHITICFKSTGNDDIPGSGTITYDVYYVNPK